MYSARSAPFESFVSCQWKFFMFHSLNMGKMHPFLAVYYGMQVLTDKTNVLLVFFCCKKVFCIITYTVGCVLFSIFKISKSSFMHLCSLVKHAEKWFLKWKYNYLKLKLRRSAKVYLVILLIGAIVLKRASC